MSKISIKKETKIPGTDYILEKGDSIHFKGRKTEAYHGHKMKTSDVGDAFDELMELLDAETIAREILNYMSTSEQADALTAIYIDYDIESEYVD